MSEQFKVGDSVIWHKVHGPGQSREEIKGHIVKVSDTRVCIQYQERAGCFEQRWIKTNRLYHWD